MRMAWLLEKAEAECQAWKSSGVSSGVKIMGVENVSKYGCRKIIKKTLKFVKGPGTAEASSIEKA